MVDIQPTATQPISDDQELAKVLAGVSQQADTGLQFEETPAPGIPTPPPIAAPEPAPVAQEPVEEAPVVEEPAPTPAIDYSTPATTPSFGGSDDLEGIKKDALNELRPLVDKLNVSPEEKFDTYLLLLRSTDDRTLIAPAHTAAQNIPDETKKAQALLDIIKEIDYLSNPQTNN